jgi:hypothetical protein
VRRTSFVTVDLGCWLVLSPQRADIVEEHGPLIDGRHRGLQSAATRSSIRTSYWRWRSLDLNHPKGSTVPCPVALAYGIHLALSLLD